MMKKLLTVCAALLGLSFPLLAATYEVKDQKRMVEVIDVVDGSMIVDVAQKIDQLSRESSAPIDMVINSPGGAVLVGTSIVDAMTVASARGVTLRCFSGVLSASMAFIILAHCDERYVLPNTKLLFHPVSTQTQGRLQELLISLDEIKRTELEVMRYLNSKMKLPKAEFHKHYFAETMWSGWSLSEVTGGNCKFLCVVDNVIGVNNAFVIEKPKAMMFRLRFRGEYEQAGAVLRRAGISLARDAEQPPVTPVREDK